MRLSTILPLASAAILASSAIARPVSYIAFRDDADLAERALGDLQVLFDRGYFGEQLSVRTEGPPHPGTFPQRGAHRGMDGLKAHTAEREDWHERARAHEAGQKAAKKAAKAATKAAKKGGSQPAGAQGVSQPASAQGSSQPAQGSSPHVKKVGSRPKAQSKKWVAPKRD
ncbi:uncharacterized protein B0H18DRAFT_424317 [Fomitopsis serialis]|uniref:uncharacterized protein n=1 Tax=Fomitopsis serialis TaxID=139415 RepID=UPI0020075D13|nr:uncharacterized protein B0H18DRAFT_424317 [Neoantrodia serialis]KAH9924512.1 hypothetical protein B0H18DRAFT_424317 [Neoantrodia serialis]